MIVRTAPRDDVMRLQQGISTDMLTMTGKRSLLGRSIKRGLVRMGIRGQNSRAA